MTHMTKKNLGRRRLIKMMLAAVFGVGTARASDSLNSDSSNAEKSFKLPKDIHVTSFKVHDGKIFLSDSYKKRVFCFSAEGEKIWESSGADRFAIPCDKFPLDISPEGELWVANTGKHRLERLDIKTGNFIAEWTPAKGFELRGCCNPMAFACIGSGAFALMEKGAWEFRIFDPAGTVSASAKIGRDWMKYGVEFDHEAESVKIFDGENIKTFRT